MSQSRLLSAVPLLCHGCRRPVGAVRPAGASWLLAVHLPFGRSTVTLGISHSVSNKVQPTCQALLRVKASGPRVAAHKMWSPGAPSLPVQRGHLWGQRVLSSPPPALEQPAVDCPARGRLGASSVLPAASSWPPALARAAGPCGCEGRLHGTNLHSSSLSQLSFWFFQKTHHHCRHLTTLRTLH